MELPPHTIADAEAGPARRFAHDLITPIVHFMDRQIPPELVTTPENHRRSKLITRFGILGGLFGFTYAAFYYFMGYIHCLVVQHGRGDHPTAAAADPVDQPGW
jgi:hypothetical protein